MFNILFGEINIFIVDGDSQSKSGGSSRVSFKLSDIFKRSKSGSEQEKLSSETTSESMRAEVLQTQQGKPTQTVIDQSARHSSGKKNSPKKETVKEAPKKTTNSKATTGSKKSASPAKAVKKKDAVEKTVKGKTSASKNTAVKPKKSEEKPKDTKKAPVKIEQPENTVGRRPPELKQLDKRLKDFAAYSRLVYDPRSAAKVFTEYMAKAFREVGYKMVLIRDIDIGLITMLDKPKGEDDTSVKDKIVVICAYLKAGSVAPDVIANAQENGAMYRSDETWCITSTDFTDAAKRRSRKEDAKVRLIDGKKLYKEFLSNYW